MKQLLKILILVLGAIMWHLVEASSQPGAPGFISPEVRKDRTVTFRYLAPNARDVKLSTQFINGQQTMLKSEKGVWSITLGPVEPDIYPYCFVVDGIQVSDPKNSLIFPKAAMLPACSKKNLTGTMRFLLQIPLRPTAG